MRRRRLAGTILIVLLAATFCIWWFGYHGQRPDLILHPPPGDDQMLVALDQPVTIRFDNVPVSEAVGQLAEAQKVTIEWDATGLNAAAVVGKEKVSGNYRDVPLGAVLDDLFSQMPFANTDRPVVGARGDRLIATSTSAWFANQSNYVTRTHRLDQLLVAARRFNVDEFAAGNAQFVPESWFFHGGLGGIRKSRAAFLLTQTVRQQRNFAALLEALAKQPEGSNDPIWIDPPASSENLKIARALREPFDTQLSDIPIKQALRQWARQQGIPIRLLDMEVVNAGGSVDTPVTCDMSQVSLRGAINALLADDWSLTYRIRYGQLWVTTRQEAEISMRLAIRVYPVRDLIKKFDDDYSMVDFITGLVEPATWSDYGGVGQIDVTNGCLVIAQTDELHLQVEDVLNDLRGMDTRIVAQAHQPHWTPTRRRIERTLRQPPPFSVENRPLGEIAERMRSELGINIRIDAKSLEEIGFSPNEPVTLDGSELTLESSLREALRDDALTVVVRNDTAEITTIEDAERRLERRFYRIDRLIHFPNTPLDPENNDPDSLIELITYIVAPQSWDASGGPGSLDAYGDLLPIATTREIHDVIGEFLAGLEHADAASDEAHRWIVGGSPLESERALAALSKPSTLVFEKALFPVVFNTMEAALGMPIIVDESDRESVGLLGLERFDGDFRGMTLGSALCHLLHDWDLSCRVTNGGLRVELNPEPWIVVYRFPWISTPDEQTALMEMLRCTTSSPEWSEFGGTGHLIWFRDLLVVSHSVEMQARVSEALKRIERFVVASTGSEPMTLPLDTPADRYTAALGSPLTETLNRVSLDESLARCANLPDLQSDSRRPKRQATSRDEEVVSLVACNVPRWIVLESLLRSKQFYLSFDQRGIRSRETLPNFVPAVLFDVRDLDRALEQSQPSEGPYVLPPYLTESSTPFGCLRLRPQDGKVMTSDETGELLRRAARSPSQSAPRLGNAVLIYTTVLGQWIARSRVKTWTEQLAAPTARESLLAKRVTLDVDSELLQEIIQQMAAQTDLPILIDPSALEGISDVDSRSVTLQVQDEPLRTALPRLFPDHDLVATDEFGVAVLKTRKAADQQLVWKTYQRSSMNSEVFSASPELPMAHVVSLVAPLSWRTFGESAICVYDGGLFVNQRRDLQRKIQKLFEVILDDPDRDDYRIRLQENGHLQLHWSDSVQQDQRIAQWIDECRNPSKPELRRWRTILMGSLPEASPKVLRWLEIELLNMTQRESVDEDRLYLLTYAVRNYREQAAPLIDALESLLKTASDSAQQAELIRAMAACGEKGAQALLRCSDVVSAEHHPAIIRLLRQYGTPARDAIPYLFGLFGTLDDNDVVAALANFDSTGAVVWEQLNDLRRDSDPVLRDRGYQITPLIQGAFGPDPDARSNVETNP